MKKHSKNISLVITFSLLCGCSASISQNRTEDIEETKTEEAAVTIAEPEPEEESVSDELTQTDKTEEPEADQSGTVSSDTDPEEVPITWIEPNTAASAAQETTPAEPSSLREYGEYGTDPVYIEIHLPLRQAPELDVSGSARQASAVMWSLVTYITGEDISRQEFVDAWGDTHTVGVALSILPEIINSYIENCRFPSNYQSKRVEADSSSCAPACSAEILYKNGMSDFFEAVDKNLDDGFPSILDFYEGEMTGTWLITGKHVYPFEVQYEIFDPQTGETIRKNKDELKEQLAGKSNNYYLV